MSFQSMCRKIVGVFFNFEKSNNKDFQDYAFPITIIDCSGKHSFLQTNLRCFHGIYDHNRSTGKIFENSLQFSFVTLKTFDVTVQQSETNLLRTSSKFLFQPTILPILISPQTLVKKSILLHKINFFYLSAWHFLHVYHYLSVLVNRFRQSSHGLKPSPEVSTLNHDILQITGQPFYYSTDPYFQHGSSRRCLIQQRDFSAAVFLLLSCSFFLITLIV